MQKVLITGGAGYIGSITSTILVKNDYIPIIFDNFEKGHAEAVSEFDVYSGDLRNQHEIAGVIKETQPAAVIHFAAYSLAGESMQEPLAYFDNNIVGALNLLKAMQENSVDQIVFSSTAAVYGEPSQVPIRETMATQPVNTYGESKKIIEDVLIWMAKLRGINSIRLRYFNVAGALADGSKGEDHDPETHLIPLIMKTLQGQRAEFTLFGDDYPTPDGTCIRDYIHVVDLAQAHIDALKRLESFQGTDVYNVGIGKGYSNLNIIKMIEEVTAQKLDYQIGPRREGDPAQLYANSDKIRSELGWEPEYGLREIIESAWKWHSTHPNGYST